jgi:hypothetical protein
LYGRLGGPYRLWGGHDIYQIPEEEKADVSEEIKKAAKVSFWGVF